MGQFFTSGNARWQVRVGAVLLALTAVGCKQAELADLESNVKRQVGVWQLAELRTVVTDSVGAVLSTVSLTNQGSVTFQLPTDPSPFNLALFDQKGTGNELVNYFRNAGAGSPTTGGGWALYWDADPSDLRLQFWGIQSGGSLHRVVNLARDGNDRQRLTYIITSKLRPNQRTFYTIDLRK